MKACVALISMVLLVSSFSFAVETVTCQDQNGNEQLITLFPASEKQEVTFEEYENLGFDECFYSVAALKKYVTARFAKDISSKNRQTQFKGLCWAHTGGGSLFTAVYRNTVTGKYFSRAGQYLEDRTYSIRARQFCK